jgi:glutathione S-transferase
MRARLALAYMNIQYEAREVDLKNKPQSLLDYSPKGTVPVLILPDGKILEESLDIILWAMPKPDPKFQKEIDDIISINDNAFKANNHRYKYAERYAEEGHSQEYYRTECEKFIQILEQKLVKCKYLIGDEISIADLAVFPLIRQFSKVNEAWFSQASYPNVRRWMHEITASKYYFESMRQNPIQNSLQST